MMYFSVEGVNLEWGEAVGPLIVKAQDREAAIEKARQFGIKVTGIEPIPADEAPSEDERFRTVRTENAAQTETEAQSSTGGPLEVFLVLAGVVALSILAAIWLGKLDNPKDALLITSTFYWTAGAILLFSAGKVLVLLADIAGSLRILIQERRPPDNS